MVAVESREAARDLFHGGEAVSGVGLLVPGASRRALRSVIVVINVSLMFLSANNGDR